MRSLYLNKGDQIIIMSMPGFGRAKKYFAFFLLFCKKVVEFFCDNADDIFKGLRKQSITQKRRIKNDNNNRNNNFSGSNHLLLWQVF